MINAGRPRLTKDEYEAWEAHPVTQIVHRYLTDLAAAMRHDWSQGQNWTDQAAWEVQALEDLAALDLGSIETFYEAREKDEQAELGGDTVAEDQRHGY